jgi:hypothetical protein
MVFGTEKGAIMEKMKIRIGGRLVEVDRIENGIPVIKAKAEEIKRPDGSQDVIIHVPCLTMAAKQENLN